MDDPRLADAPACARETDLILDVFRRATAGRHAAIDDLLQLRSPFGRAHYGCVLQGFAAFLEGWEPRMAALLPQRLQAWFTQGRRLHLLRLDLHALGLHAPSPHSTWPELQTLPQALGSLYVVEGSALGGQFIAAQAKRLLGLTPTHGSAYFHGAGRGTVARWRETGTLLAEELGEPAARSAAVRSAESTFDTLHGLFQRELHERAPA